VFKKTLYLEEYKAVVALIFGLIVIRTTFTLQPYAENAQGGPGPAQYAEIVRWIKHF